MLTRIAGNSYWMARYLERAENNARVLRMAGRHACLPEADATGLWSTALEVGGTLDHYQTVVGAIAAPAVVRFMVLERSNTSGIVSCLHLARDNARTARHLLTDSTWETINGVWMEAQALDEARLDDLGVEGVVSWTLARCRMIEGHFGDLWRDTMPHVIDLGRVIERADFTARILAEMLPRLRADGLEPPPIGSAAGRRWLSLCEGLGLSESWRRVGSGRLDPVAMLRLILLHPSAPHGLLVNVRAMAEAIRGFSPGREGAALQTALAIEARLMENHVESVDDAYCRSLTALTNRLGVEVQRDHFA